MNRKLYILMLLFSSWLVANLHRGLNNLPVKYIHPCPLDKQYEVSRHWYIHFVLKDISYIFIFLGVWLYLTSNMKKDKDVVVAFGALFFVQILDLIHYLLWARHNEWVLLLQGAIITAAAAVIRFKKSSKLLAWIGY